MTDEFQSEAGEVGEFKAGLTDDAFLGGKLHLLQPKKGYRAGLDAVLLAATVPASNDDRVFEAGLGTGVAAACLASRLSGITVTGVEMASRYVLIAEENAKRNNLAGRIKVLKGDMLDSMRHDQPDWPAAGSFAHAYANPPFFDDNTVQHPADTLRAQAHLLKAGELDAWVKLMTGMVRQRGTVTVIHPATSLQSLLAAMAPRLGALAVLPLRAHADSEASRIIVRGVKGSKAPLKLLPGLVLHRNGSNAFVPEVDAILRAGEALELS